VQSSLSRISCKSNSPTEAVVAAAVGVIVMEAVAADTAVVAEVAAMVDIKP